jgi:hypothetical protein
MHHYLTQLIQDLETIAANPPDPPWTETPPHLAHDPVIAELALTPFKPISEWTGIHPEMFPGASKLKSSECERVNQAIFKVYNAFNLSLIDCPEDHPPEILYDLLTDNWDLLVQYLPSSGMDVELCTREAETCPYGDYCECCEQEPHLHQEIYKGFYNDDGEKIDPESVPIPSLCLICKSYNADDWEENLLCLMNRYDQKDDEKFECGAYEKR